MKFPLGTECLGGVKAGGTFVLIVSKTSTTIGTDYTVVGDVSFDFYVHNYNMYYSYANANTYDFDYFLHISDYNIPDAQNWLAKDPVLYNGINRFYNAIQIFKQTVSFQSAVAPVDIRVSFTKVMKAAQLFPGGWKYASRMQASNVSAQPPGNAPTG